MEIGVHSFGHTLRDEHGELRPTAEAIRNLHEAIVHADRVGLDYFGVGEHHTAAMPASSPGTVIAAAAAATEQIILSSAASVISTDDPVRVFQQFAIADAISGGGRVEITAGRGSSVDSFPLFGYELGDYDRLYSEKLDLLMTLNVSHAEEVSWSGSVRSPLRNSTVVPRPVRGRLPVWLATGGSPQSSVRAGTLGLPVSYGILGGPPARFGQLAKLYRTAAAQSGHNGADIKASVAGLGLVAATREEALERFYPAWRAVHEEASRTRGWLEPDHSRYLQDAGFYGPLYVGGPDDIAERIADLYDHMGHVRHFLQADIGGLSHEHFLESITLLATEVKPRVERLLHNRQ